MSGELHMRVTNSELALPSGSLDTPPSIEVYSAKVEGKKN